MTTRAVRVSVRATICAAVVACASTPMRAQTGVQEAGAKHPKVAEVATPEVQATIARIQSLYLQNRMPEAAKLGEQLVKEHRDSIEAWLALAGVHLSSSWRMRRDARAESASRRALQLGGHRPDIVQGLATALYRQCKYDECQPLLEELIESKPPMVAGESLADVLHLRASIALRRDALDPEAHARAFADLERALEVAPNYAPVRRLRAETLIADGKLAEALVDLQIAVVSDPGDMSVHYEMHRCLSRLKRCDEAKHHYEIWRMINALTDSIAQVNAPDMKERLDLLRKLKELNPADLSRRLDLAEHEIALGDADAAIKECDELLALQAKWPAAEHLREQAQRAKAGAKPDLPNSHADDGGGGE